MTAPTPNLLRGLVITNAALFFLIFVTALGYGLLTTVPEHETLGMPAEEMGVAELLTCCALVPLVVAQLASFVGLFMMRNWGRWLQLGTLISSYLLRLPISLFEVSEVWGFGIALSEIESLVSGLILGLVFYSPLARDFAITNEATQN